MVHFLIWVTGLFLVFAGMTAVADEKPPFKIMTKRDSDRVQVKLTKGQAIISVHSAFGISLAVIERTNGEWPDVVVLRLYLKGLENFRVTNGKVKLEGSASLQDGKSVLRLWKDGKEDQPLDAKSPFWMSFRIVGADGQPAQEIPLKNGYFEMRFPRALFEGNPKSLTMSWIDFYRN